MAFSLKDYSNLKRIGSGGMGNVYSAIQRSLNRIVAIKEMTIANRKNAALINCFENEAKFAAALDHTNIIRIYDYGVDKGSFYIAMEYIDGYTLEQLLIWNPFPKEMGLLIMHQALKGLYFSHSREIAHCDIKPNNILVSRTGRVVVTDFGIANASAHAITHSASNKIFITPAYIPPEQAIIVREQVMSRDSAIDTLPIFVSEASTASIPDLDFRKDIWSVGVLLYRIITGRLPFNGKTAMATVLAIQREIVTPFSSLIPILPDNLAGCIDASLIKEPRKRLTSLDPLIHELQELVFDYGFRDPESEIRNYIADPTAYSGSLEKKVTDYHIRKGTEFKASGNTIKSLAHFEVAKRIIFDPSKNDQPIAPFPWQSKQQKPPQTNTESDLSTDIPKKAISKIKASTVKKIITGIAFFLMLIALLFATTLTLKIIQRTVIMRQAHAFNQSASASKTAFTPPTDPVPPPAPVSPSYLKDTVLPSDSNGNKGTGKPDTNHALTIKTGEIKSLTGKADQTAKARPYIVKRKNRSLSGILVVTVDPSSAYLFVDEVGIPREELSRGKFLPTGPHLITAIAEGYQSFTEAIMVRKDSTITLGITLKRTIAGNGSLHVYCYPWAELYIDGSYQGQAPTPNPVQLAEGSHSLRLQRDGYKTHSENIIITANEKKRIQIELEKGW
jgi:serine/threonine protein kinase